MKKRFKLFLVSLLTAAFVLSVQAQTAGDRVITGKVVDETGEPLIGAGVVSADGKRGAVTDLDGKYSVTLKRSDKTLSVSFIGE